MDWRNDPEVQDSIRELLTKSKEPLGVLLNSLGKHNDGSPPFQFLKVLGMFVWRYDEYLKENTETDSFELSVASIANDPTVQILVDNMMRNNLDRGLNLD